MNAVEKFYLRNSLSDARLDDIVRHVRDAGRGEASYERVAGEVALYVEDRGDAELVKDSYAHLIEAEVDLSQ